MQNIYVEVSPLDKRVVEKFALSEEIMMEHAALSIVRYIQEHFSHNSHVLIVCGSGNNGADGLVCARLLMNDYQVSLHLPFGATTPLAQLQRERIEKLGLKNSDIDSNYDVIIDALFGSGLNRPLGPTALDVMQKLNTLQGFKIACDVPSGLFPNGKLSPHTFYADLTITMGSLKRSLFSDASKEITGEITVADLGVHRTHYEIDTPWKMLDSEDLKLPHRTHASTHKGSYGHLAVICGEKTGAAIIAGSAALHFGTGLVSLISNENVSIPFELMQSHSIPETATAITLGMGLGLEFCDDELKGLLANTYPLLLDADIFYHSMFRSLLGRSNIILTPHPKEFTQILKVSGIADIDVQTLQEDRFTYVEKFCAAFPNVVLVLKGAHVIIAHHERFYINPHGTVSLAKGGSGDVLSGLIGALLAQGFTPLDAAIHGSLAHTAAAQKFTKNNYALTPLDLIESVTSL